MARWPVNPRNPGDSEAQEPNTAGDLAKENLVKARLREQRDRVIDWHQTPFEGLDREGLLDTMMTNALLKVLDGDTDKAVAVIEAITLPESHR